VNRFKQLFIAMALLALLSQTVAATLLPCTTGSMNDINSSGSSATSGSDMAGMDHSVHFIKLDAGNDEPSVAPQSDCCNTSGGCLMAGCVAASFVAATLSVAESRIYSPKINHYSHAIANPFLSSPQRPPISRYTG
jgi:hypothetical protein